MCGALNFPKSAQNPGRRATKEGRSRMAGLAGAKWANGACWRIRPLWGLHALFTPHGPLSTNYFKISTPGVNQARFIYKGEVTLPGLHHSRPGGQLVRFPQPAARIKSPLYCAPRVLQAAVLFACDMHMNTRALTHARTHPDTRTCTRTRAHTQARARAHQHEHAGARASARAHGRYRRVPRTRRRRRRRRRRPPTCPPCTPACNPRPQ